jgi:UDP-N-acetylmuramate--alanine ligase
MRINDTDIKKAYFIGIGGIGMSALAQLLKDHDVDVSGSDREGSPVVDLLGEKGITVLSQDGTHVPPDADVAVYSEAVWEDNPDRMKCSELGIPQKSYFDMLGDVSVGKKTIAIAGTNGKTTTTAMLTKILADAGTSPTAVVGSLVKDFGSNYVSGTSDMFVVEACEYKRDFLTLSPTFLVITNIEWDHTDYYKDLADVQDAFRTLIEKIPEHGALITDTTHPHIAPLLTGLTCKVLDYKTDTTYTLRLPGAFNQMNAQAAAIMARVVAPQISEDSIATSLSHFHGTWRRFEYKGKTTRGADVYDDYAHHPSAVSVTLSELKKKATGKVYVAFHPHLYSRTRDLLKDFTTAFSTADEVYIAPIYAAREVDDGTISSEILAGEIAKTGTKAEAHSFEEIEEKLAGAVEGDVVVTMGAGDIYKIADALVRHG